MLTVIPALNEEASIDPRDAVGWFVEIASDIRRGNPPLHGQLPPFVPPQSSSSEQQDHPRGAEVLRVRWSKGCVQPVVENLR